MLSQLATLKKIPPQSVRTITVTPQTRERLASAALAAGRAIRRHTKDKYETAIILKLLSDTLIPDLPHTIILNEDELKTA